MGLIRDIEHLEPATQEKAKSAIGVLNAKGIPYFVNETLRLRTTQWCYFLQGRVSLEVVNQFRQDAGLWPLTAAENQKQVTQTLKSKHLEGTALDIVPATADGPWWTAPMEKYQEIADVMKANGFDWGGDWKGFQDCPHYQLKEAT